MKAQINSNFILDLGESTDILNDIANFENEMTKTLQVVEKLEDEHGISLSFSTKEKNGEQVLKIDLK